MEVVAVASPSQLAGVIRGTCGLRPSSPAIPQQREGEAAQLIRPSCASETSQHDDNRGAGARGTGRTSTTHHGGR